MHRQIPDGTGQNPSPTRPLLNPPLDSATDAAAPTRAFGGEGMLPSHAPRGASVRKRISRQPARLSAHTRASHHVGRARPKRLCAVSKTVVSSTNVSVIPSAVMDCQTRLNSQIPATHPFRPTGDVSDVSRSRDVDGLATGRVLQEARLELTDGGLGREEVALEAGAPKRIAPPRDPRPTTAHAPGPV